MRINDLVRVFADMVMMNHNDVEEKGVGLYIGKDWLTPSQCYDIADLIEKVNNEYYGEGNWTLDKKAVLILRNHSYQNNSDIY